MDNDSRNRPLRVAEVIATRATDDQRGPLVAMNPDDAKARLLTDGELAWVYGPRRHELATVFIDEGIRRGDVIVRDLIVAAASEIVRVIKPDLDNRGRRPSALA